MSPPDSDYFLEIESHFALRRGTPFLLSSKDWALMKEWREGAIPLSVVLEAIDRCFDKREQSGRKGTISSLTYCRHAVREIWNERKELHAGGASTIPENDPASELARLVSELAIAAERQTGAIGALLRKASGEVTEVSAAASVPSIEQLLLEIEDRLIEGVIPAMPDELRRSLEEEISALLSAYQGIDPESLTRTRQANLRRLVRARLGIPRLSLFG